MPPSVSGAGGGGTSGSMALLTGPGLGIKLGSASLGGGDTSGSTAGFTGAGTCVGFCTVPGKLPGTCGSFELFCGIGVVAISFYPMCYLP